MKFRDLKLEHNEIAIIRDKKTNKIITIGDVNQCGGICDCCPEISYDNEIDLIKIIEVEDLLNE